MTDRVLLSWSSGKDSAWALEVLRRGSGWNVGALLTTVNETADRVAMHAVRVALLEAQAESAGLPVRIVRLPWPCSNDEYERRMAAATAQAVADGFTHVAFGDVFLEDVRRYREERLHGSGLEPLFPLWGRDSAALASEMIEAGLRARITTVDPRALDPRFITREFDRALLGDLPPAVDPCGERGEFHTFAYAGPMFGVPIPIETGEVVERDGFVFADLRVPQGRDRQGTAGTRV
jgi:uncharacterized protein (TIGR00290 family)